MRDFGPVARLRPFGSTIFAEMTDLAIRHDALNLGQGFPDASGPKAMLDLARQAIADGRNQYPPGRGIAELRTAIVADRERRYGMSYDPDSEVVVTIGATEAIAAAVLGLVEPRDEVAVIEPYYDSYAATIALAGAVRRTARLVPDGDGFTLDVDSLAAAVTPRTRMLLLNTPHNPTSSMLSRPELAAIAEIAQANDLIVVADEVYEHLVFDGREHVSIASLPGMAERTIVISSAAKTFSVTGWKVGWALGPANLIDGVLSAKQFLSYAGSGPFQPAVAYALEHEQGWVRGLAADLAERRDLLTSGLRAAGLAVRRSDAGYFVCADISAIGETDGLAYCRALPEHIGVAAIPVSVFTDGDPRWRTLVRFTFAKNRDTIEAAAHRLASATRG